MNRFFNILVLIVLLCLACTDSDRNKRMNSLKVSENGRFLEKSNGDPFFWLGDTGWLLFAKLNREEAVKYLENRRQKGFNVIQVMILHTLSIVNAYGDSALTNHNTAYPKTTPGNRFENPGEYDYWDHVDYIINEAAKKGLYMAMVPVWGSNVRKGLVSNEQAEVYAAWLADRYRGKPNIIWLNGGDIKGSDSTRIWNTIGNTLKEHDPGHLITYHPFGRTQSSAWFHDEQWLDFNMFQSGHRRYDQDDTELHYGEDNWRYVITDYNKLPVKPTIDGEPSYEAIPQGLHDTLQPYWTDNEVRRYGYWSVFSGSFGHTYGHNAVMQMYKPGNKEKDFGPKDFWFNSLDDPGAGQMIHLKNLILSRPFFERVPDQSLIDGEQGEKYDYQPATRGNDYAFIYTYNGRNIRVNMGKISGAKVKAAWYNPRDGNNTNIGTFENTGVAGFDPPGEQQDGNDWVLILDSVK